MTEPEKPTAGRAAIVDSETLIAPVSATQPRVSARAETPLDEVVAHDRYETKKLLGAGGMGDVHLSYDRHVGRNVALKTLRHETTPESEVRSRFVREARVQGQLEHPAIVPVYDLGVDARGAPFFAMKRVSGLTLECVLDGWRAGDPETRARYTRARLLSVFLQVCKAIDYAHGRGVIHRDLKPANVMVGDFGEVYVLDWGLARLTATDGDSFDSLEAPSRTVEGRIMGTPGYMAPEQLAGLPVDVRADVYALGAMLFEILAGRKLHPGSSVHEIIRSTQLGVDAGEGLAAAEHEAPPELASLCAAATALDPATRLEGARELWEPLERFLEGDRDLEARQKLATAHADAARRAAGHALEKDGARDHENRRVALHEAGRALALDPRSGAAEVLLSLMTTPPVSTPPDVARELDATRAAELGFGLKLGAIAYGGFALLALAILMAPVKSWLGFALIEGCIVAAAIGMAFASRRPFRAMSAMVLSGLAFVAISASAGIYGPLVLVPGLAAANTIAICVLPIGRLRYTIVALGCAALAIPLGLELARALPSSYLFHDGAMTLIPRIVEFEPLPVLFGLSAASFGTILIPVLVVWRLSNVVRELRERVALQSWQLRQLLPPDAGV